MPESSSVLVTAGLFGVVLPTAVAGGAALLARGRAVRSSANAAAGAGVALGVGIAAHQLAGPLTLPPPDSTQWLVFAVIAGGLLGAFLSLLLQSLAVRWPAGGDGSPGNGEGRAWGGVGVAARTVAFGALAYAIVSRLLGPLAARDAATANAELWRLVGLGALAQLGLEALLTGPRDDAPRLRSFLALAAAGVLLGGAAATLALARSLLLAQLLGAAAAAVGGLALAGLAGVRPVAMRSASMALGAAYVVAIGAGQHYASLPASVATLLLLVPALAGAAAWFTPAGWGAAASIGVAAASVGGAARMTHTALEVDAEPAAATPGAVELDYGYGGSAPATDTAADPYLDPKLMEGWKPPDAPAP